MCSGGKVTWFSISSEIQAPRWLFFELASMTRVFEESSTFLPPFKVLFLSMGVLHDPLGMGKSRKQLSNKSCFVLLPNT